MVTIRVDVTQPVLDWDGEPLHHQRLVGNEAVDVLEDGKPKIFTIRNAIAQAMNGVAPAEAQTGQPPEIKEDVFRIMCLVATADLADLDDADRTMIRERSKLICNALIHGRIGEAFDAGEKVGPRGKTNGQGKVDKKDLEAV